MERALRRLEDALPGSDGRTSQARGLVSVFHLAEVLGTEVESKISSWLEILLGHRNISSGLPYSPLSASLPHGWTRRYGYAIPMAIAVSTANPAKR